MTDPNYTDITFVLDRSGSMRAIQQPTIDGFAAFIAEQRGVPGRCTVTLNQFDNKFKTVYTARELNAVPPLRLKPRGTTALLDAIGRSVHATGARLAAMPEHARPGTVIVAIMTDGLENDSTEYTRPMIRQLIDEHETRYSWTFLYMGAGQDAVEVGTDLGVDFGYSLTYDSDGTDAALKASGSNVAKLRSAMMSGSSLEDARQEAAYSDEQRWESSSDGYDLFMSSDFGYPPETDTDLGWSNDPWQLDGDGDGSGAPSDQQPSPPDVSKTEAPEQAAPEGASTDVTTPAVTRSSWLFPWRSGRRGKPKA